MRVKVRWWLAILPLIAWWTLGWWQWFQTNPAGWSAGHVFIWGDWAAHLGYVHHFRWQDPTWWWQTFPSLSRAPFMYPPLSSLLTTGIWWILDHLLKSDAALWLAMVTPVWVGGIVSVYLLWKAGQIIGLKPIAAAWATTGLILSASFGWLRWLGEAMGWLSTLTIGWPHDFPSKDFDHGFAWVNPIVSMFVPQRSFALGFPLWLALTALATHALLKSEKISNRAAVGLGMALGGGSFFLFLAHVHGTLVLAWCAAWWFAYNLKSWRVFIPWATIAGLLILSWVILIWQGSTGSGLIWHLGWMTAQPVTFLGIASFWLWNWGFIVPLGLVGWIYLLFNKDRAYARTGQLLTPLILLWPLGNVVQIQNWSWDNSKVFIFSMFGFIAAIALALQREWPKISKYLKIVIYLVITLHLVGGIIDLAFLLRWPGPNWMMLDRNALTFAQQIRNVVPSGSPVVTAPVHDHPVSVAGGRSAWIGFPGWIWSYGLAGSDRENQLLTIYGSDGNAQQEILRSNTLRWVVYGPPEKSLYPNTALPNTCTPVLTVDTWELYDCEPIIEAKTSGLSEAPPTKTPDIVSSDK